jgi:hypothetical protein
MSRTTTSYAQWFNNAVAAAADEAWGRYAKGGLSSPLYLYFKRHGLEFKVADVVESVAGYELVSSDRIPSNLTAVQITAWMHPLCARVPVLPRD